MYDLKLLELQAIFCGRAMNLSGLAIGQVAREAKCSVASLRYYEEIGLLPNVGRRPSGHCAYGSSDVKRLAFIRRCRDFGFSIERARQLLASQRPAPPCTDARDIAYDQRQIVRGKLLELQRSSECSRASW